MVGGIVANNSSGMCCGVSQNTYHTLKDMRVVFVDGTVLDTADEMSRNTFLKVSLGGRARGDVQLVSSDVSWLEVVVCHVRLRMG